MGALNDNITENQPQLRYRYQRLPSRTSFRILELLPGEKNAPISYRLHIADWADSTQYEAVSYTWGDINQKTKTTCDGLDLMITHNLKDALVSMRRQDQSRFLWADAVCIDQTNIEERGHQVSHMGDIYRRATRVVVWLGSDENGQGRRAIAAMEEIAARCLGLSIEGLLKEESRLRFKDELWDLIPENMLEGLRYDDADSVQALVWFFSRPWFGRLWVIQEVVSNRSVEVLCGDNRISWDVVVLTATYVRRHAKIYIQWNLSDTLTTNAFYMRRRYWQQQVSLPSLLNWGRSFNTTEPLDRVYGLMAMPSFIESGMGWQADYSKSKVELYKDVAYKYILNLRSLRILCYSQHQGKDKTFPSWVPQWDRQKRYEAIDESLSKGRWQSSANSKLSVNINAEYGVLELTGIIADTIASFRPLPDSMGSQRGQISQDHPIVEFWKRQHQQEPPNYFTGETQLEALSLVLAAGLNIDRRKVSEALTKFRAHFGAYLGHLLESMGQTWSTAEGLQGVKEQGDRYGYERLVRTKCHNRSLFFTRKGYMGLGPDVQGGDIVCIFFGAEVPFVIRPKDTYYELVGDAYVHGIMDGKVMEMYEAGILKEQTFEIH